MNVAITRSRSSLFIIGHAPTLERSNETWKQIVEDARSRACLSEVKHPLLFYCYLLLIEIRWMLQIFGPRRYQDRQPKCPGSHPSHLISLQKAERRSRPFRQIYPLQRHSDLTRHHPKAAQLLPQLPPLVPRPAPLQSPITMLLHPLLLSNTVGRNEKTKKKAQMDLLPR